VVFANALPTIESINADCRSKDDTAGPARHRSLHYICRALNIHGIYQIVINPAMHSGGEVKDDINVLYRSPDLLRSPDVPSDKLRLARK
jgi:hypothetical protein